jgi:hypothetical protein
MTADDRELVAREAEKVLRHFEASFGMEKRRLPDGSRLLERYQAAALRVVELGWSALPGREEAHNELCVAESLLRSVSPRFAVVRYEPPIPGSRRTIDFLAVTPEATYVWVDVKTIHPRTRDRWAQFAEISSSGLFPDNVDVQLERDWLGGEIWHWKYAARAKMLDYAHECEAKLAAVDAGAGETRPFGVLVYCGTGFHWHRDELEDFVAFYSAGRHRDDDPFRVMEQHFLESSGTLLTRRIDQIALMYRAHGELNPSKLVWRVVPPPEPWLESAEGGIAR